MVEMVTSLVLSPRRRTPATDGGEEAWLRGVVPCLGTNFLLNEGTLKFGAGGDALRANVSGILDGVGSTETGSVREGVGIGGETGDIYSD